MSDLPTVAVALLTRNRPALLRLALASVLAQQCVDLSVIVLDNASTDETPDVARSFAVADERVSYVRHEPDIGIVRNWNRGIELACARSPLVSIFHDDDVMLPGFLAESARALEAHPTAGMSLCLAQYVGPDGSQRGALDAGDVKDGLNDGLDFLELAAEGRCISIPPPIVLFRRINIVNTDAQGQRVVKRAFYNGEEKLPNSGVIVDQGSFNNATAAVTLVDGHTLSGTAPFPPVEAGGAETGHN